MKLEEKRTILFGVLNWGLGHATRSVPVIEALLKQGFNVVLASDGEALRFLRNRFTDLAYGELPAYNIRYAKGKNSLLRLVWQLPKIVAVKRKEHQQLQKLIRLHNAIGVISDNRLGFYSKKLPSVYISHQLSMVSPIPWAGVKKIHHRVISKFDACWVPDFEERSVSLAGDISHSNKPKVPLYFLGPLSRYSGRINTSQKKYKVLAVLSGPEPQRSLLAKKLEEELLQLKVDAVLILGKARTGTKQKEGLTIIDWADSEQLLELMSQSEMVISRSGYSSIMDYYYLGKKALLIPTLGQPEQEYLARWQMHCGRFAYVAQDKMDLPKNLKEAQRYSGFSKNELPIEPNWEQLFLLFKGKRES